MAAAPKHGRSTKRSLAIGLALVAAISGCKNKVSDAGDDPQLQAGSASSGTGGVGNAGAMSGAAGSTQTGNETMAGSGGSPSVAGNGGAGTTAAGMSGSNAAAGSDAMSDAGPMPQNDGGMVGPATGPFPPVTDLEGDGPFTGTTMDGVGPNSNYTVYLPTELAPGGAKNPIVVWMSGGGTGPALYVLLPHLATHGFVVIASNTLPGIGAEFELGEELVAGIDWAIAENQRQGSMFYGKLDETKIASMGYSMGSLATFTIADDPRLTTTVHISGGNMDTSRVGMLHAPAAFLCGEPGTGGCADILSPDCDIAGANCATDFMAATTPVFYGVFPGGHLGILTDPLATQIGGVATGWLRWKLMSDETLAPMFVGDQCTLCSDPGWKVQQKGL